VKKSEKRKAFAAFADAEAAVLDMPPLPSAAQMDRGRAARAIGARGALRKIRRLEASAQAATARAASARDAVGVLQGSNATFYLKKRETALGRSTDDQRWTWILAKRATRRRFRDSKRS